LGFRKIIYNTGESLVDIKIKEGRDTIIESWVVMMNDLPKWFNLIRKKYGIINKERDLDWAK